VLLVLGLFGRFAAAGLFILKRSGGHFLFRTGGVAADQPWYKVSGFLAGKTIAEIQLES
jgi:hypothetical protein